MSGRAPHWCFESHASLFPARPGTTHNHVVHGDTSFTGRPGLVEGRKGREQVFKHNILFSVWDQFDKKYVSTMY